jgi:predicted TIM-barrel fold metal-dependent hydrolase
MIDTHAHACRSLPEPLGRLAARVPVVGLPLDIERVAAVRRFAPPSLHAAMEMTLSLGMVPQVLLRGTLDHLRASMDRFGIAKTVVIAGPPVAPNEWLIEEARRDPAGRIIPVAVLPSVRSEREQDWIDAWESLARAGARGFKIHPNLDAQPATHPAYRALFTVAKTYGRFVILHTGCFHVLGYRNQRPADAREFTALFADFPTVRVCLAHMNRDRPEGAWELMARHLQLYTDTSWQPAEAIARALSHADEERILLGSDWPLLHARLQGDAVATLRRAATDAQVERVTTRNAEAFLGAP